MYPQGIDNIDSIIVVSDFAVGKKKKTKPTFKPLRGPTYLCAICGGQAIDQGRCILLSSTPQRNKQCCEEDCESPWRICRICARTGEAKQEAKIVSDGLCKFHLEYGEDAKRSDIPQQSKEEPTRQITVEPLIGREKKVRMLPVDKIELNPQQPREYFSEKGLAGLAASEKIIGQLDPVKVWETPDGDFVLIDGERRLRAARKNHELEIEATVVKGDLTDEELFLFALVANANHQSYTHLEIALGAQKIIKMREDAGPIENYDGLMLEIAQLFGFNSSTSVYQHLSLLKLTKEVQVLLEPDLPKQFQLSYAAAQEIAKRVPTGPQQMIAAQTIIKEGMRTFSVKAFLEREFSTKRKGESSGSETSRTAPKKGRGRLPSDDFEVFLNFMDRTSSYLENFFFLGEERILKMFARRKPVEVQAVVAQLRQISKKFQDLADLIEKLKKEQE